jgi:hypothetical protein
MAAKSVCEFRAMVTFSGFCCLKIYNRIIAGIARKQN